MGQGEGGRVRGQQEACGCACHLVAWRRREPARVVRLHRTGCMAGVCVWQAAASRPRPTQGRDCTTALVPARDPSQTPGLQLFLASRSGATAASCRGQSRAPALWEGWHGAPWDRRCLAKWTPDTASRGVGRNPSQWHRLIRLQQGSRCPVAFRQRPGPGLKCWGLAHPNALWEGPLPSVP